MKQYYKSHFGIKHLCGMIVMYMIAIRKDVSRKAAVWGMNHKNISMMVTWEIIFTGEKKYSVCLLTHIVRPQTTNQSLLTTLYGKGLYGAWLCVSWLLVRGTWVLFPVVLHETCGSKITSFISCQPDFTVLKNMSSGEEYPQPSWCSGLLFAFWPLD